ncbi:hypothetical protein PbB2_00104 [Candidatus Phycosocius bacilliformis]|uniref:Chromosome partition protein Smc n=1 Tax=Candidatus Phycosocius bacilliformis TaxID=1445552 RepID=A0A2P2E5X2_9PROT|nr:hypothetical protein [Candidatus Phycosocius bacilliformis]GBF56448.1 hypothetical protein PbB2_00104 [Candidatus Phycosocius bacilliformis]
MAETAPRTRAKEPSHTDLLVQIGLRFDRIEARLDHGEKRFDRLEDKIDKAEQTRAEMVRELATLQATADAHQASVDANKTPPWWLSWKPVAIIVVLSVFAGAGLTALAIAGLDIVPKLTAIKAAVHP